MRLAAHAKQRAGRICRQSALPLAEHHVKCPGRNPPTKRRQQGRTECRRGRRSACTTGDYIGGRDPVCGLISGGGQRNVQVHRALGSCGGQPDARALLGRIDDLVVTHCQRMGARGRAIQRIARAGAITTTDQEGCCRYEKYGRSSHWVNTPGVMGDATGRRPIGYPKIRRGNGF